MHSKWGFYRNDWIRHRYNGYSHYQCVTSSTHIIANHIWNITCTYIYTHTHTHTYTHAGTHLYTHLRSRNIVVYCMFHPN